LELDSFKLLISFRCCSKSRRCKAAILKYEQNKGRKNDKDTHLRNIEGGEGEGSKSATKGARRADRAREKGEVSVCE